MADAQNQPPEDEDLVLSFFPDPPPFYKHFTAENLARLKDVKKEASGDNDDNRDASTAPATKLSAEQILALPTELRYLIPPEPPADDEDFHVFDVVAKAKGTDIFTKNMEFLANQLGLEEVLPDWSYERLYPSADTTEPTTSTSLDRQNYLFRFLRSILLSYMSLLGIVAVDPASEQKDQKLKDIMTLVANMHALINEYRPHQARQTLIERMEEQVRRKREEVEGVRRMGEKVREVLGGFARLDLDAGRDGLRGAKEESEQVVLRSEDEVRREMQRAMWEGLEEIM
ncbi:hypothetical protein BDW02DRAFT_462670, partial [Decorospora gaudefroyi]